MSSGAAFKDLVSRALDRRSGLVRSGATDAFRVFAGESDGLTGVFIDRYGPGAVLIVYEGSDGRAPIDSTGAAEATLSALAPLGVTAVYVKVFAKDRSRLGGLHPAALSDPTPEAGAALPEWFEVNEHGTRLEVRLYDGFSTGIFLDQRENRRHLAEVCARSPGMKVLNTFCYTGAFSAACARAGAVTASVDVSGRYLDWAKRNFALNGLDPAPHRFAKMDTFEFFDYAERKGLRFDLVILDPPSFASAPKSGGRAWSSVTGYSRLVAGAARLLEKGGVIFASTNTVELCRVGRLDREIVKGLGARPKWLGLPAPPADFGPCAGRFAARLFSPT